MDLLTVVGVLVTVLETFPVWGPVLVVGCVVLVCQAVRAAGDDGDTDGDAVPAVVSPAGDKPETGLRVGRVTCGDTRPRLSRCPGTGCG
jgi:hypothetical protein